MKAAVLREVGRPLEIEEVQIDRPGPHEVLIRTRATGVCRSDLHYIAGNQTIQMPAVLGHEASGTVEAVGGLVSYVKPGDHIIACLSVFCGHCNKCLSGRPSLCSRNGVVRSPSDPPRLRQGETPITQLLEISSFAEQMLVHENSVVTVQTKRDIPFEQLALIGCAVTTGVGAVLNTAHVEPGSTVAVIGCGGVGLNCIQAAVIAGASRIIAIDEVKTKLTIAQEFGATDVIHASDNHIVARVRELTGGGVDYSFEAIGKKQTVEQSFDMLGTGGVATVIGLPPENTKIELDANAFIGERRIQGSNMGSNRFRIDMPRYIALYNQGRLKLDELVSQRLRLDQINDAFEDMKRGHLIRSVVVFTE